MNTINKALGFIFNNELKEKKTELKTSEELNFYKIVKAYTNYRKNSYSDRDLLNDFVKVQQKVNKIREKRLLLRVASVLIFFSISVVTYFSLETKQKFDVYTNNSVQKSLIRLKDGSRIHLFANSTLKVPRDLSASNRYVELNGQAFCEIKTDKKSIFYVRTNNLNIQVHGTKFNVRDFDEENSASTTLTKGSIKLELPKQNQIINVYPSEKYILNKRSKKVELQKIPDDTHMSWINNSLRFNNSRFNDVIKSLEIYYGKDIEIKSEFIDTNKITCVFKNKSLAYILNSLKQLVDYEIENNNNTIILH
jgi:ferric-dicitrate binding protein FerR (iron transport regulator)